MAEPSGTSLASDVHAQLGSVHSRLSLSDAALIDSQIAVSEIAAPTGDESERGAWVAHRFEAIGLVDIAVDETGNVIGRRQGRRSLPPVAICAHLDTVFPRGTNLTVRRDGHRLFGPGINDNGRGLAVMLALAEAINGASQPTDRPIEFVATTGEEGAGDLRGAKHYFATRGRDASAAIIVDGAGDERIVHRALGSRRFRIAFEGAGGHSWAAYGTPNAVHAAAAAATAVASLPLPGDPRTTLTVARIGGGLSVNSIPAQAWMDVDVRSSSSHVIDAIEKQIQKAVTIATVSENSRRATGSPELKSRIDVIGDRPCGETSENHPLVRAAVQVTRLVGRAPELAMASTDANVPISIGIPAIAIGGGGRGGDAHTAAEWYDNTAGTVGVARALSIIVTAAESS